MSNEFTLSHGSATTEKAVQAAGRVESIVGDVVNGSRRAWGRIAVEDVALLVQHARDAAASPNWLDKMAINALSARCEALKDERDGAVDRAEVAERRLRITAALIIAAIGSVGPEDAEDAARRLGDVAVERDAALAERDRLRAVIAEAAADLPSRPEGAYLTPPEDDAEAVRLALLAALRGEA
jgi:hypothetical protein